MLNNLLIGNQRAGDNQIVAQRGGNLGDTIVSELHGRFYEQTMRGNLYTFGLSNTALAAANAIATGLTASAQPIIAIYNPLGNGYNAVILQAIVVVTTVANTAVSPGGFQWVYSSNNAAISTGSSPINLKTLAAAGSNMKAFACATALTGLSNNLAFLRASAISSAVNAAGPGTAIPQAQGVCVDNVDGGLLVPPGCVVGLMNQLSTTTLSVSVGIVWEEVPLP
jgi:hypothetical protein